MIIKIFLFLVPLLIVGLTSAYQQALANSISTSHESIKISIDSLTVELSSKSGTISRIFDLKRQQTVSRGVGGIYLIDGETKTNLYAHHVTDARVREREVDLEVDYGDPGILITYHLELVPKGILWSVNIANKSNRLRMFEVRLGLPIDFSLNVFNYWDGYDHHFESPNSPIFQRCAANTNLYAINALPTTTVKGGKRPKFPFSKNMVWGNVCIFPMNCLWSQDFGVALGVSPLQPVSYYSGGVQPVLSSQERFYYALKYVVMPNATESQTFVLYPFQGKRGYRAALKTYYDLFPQAFEKPKSIPSKVFLPATGGYLTTLINLYEHDLGDLWAEFCRRYSVGWMWLYAPFQETGEWFPSPETYRPDWIKKYRTASQIGSRKTNFNSDTIARGLETYDAYREYLAKIIAYAQRSAAIGWYIIPQRCSIRIADQYYQDAIIYRWNSIIPYFMRTGPSGHPQYSMFALNNNFGKKNKQDIDKILTIAGVDGIAFDNALAFEHYTGEGVLKSHGRAFRDGKPYVVNNLAYRDLEKYVRNLHLVSSKGCRPVVFTNGPFNIATAMYTDACLIEYHPYQPANMVSAFAMLRYLLGPEKPISFKVHGRAARRQIAAGKGDAADSLTRVYNERLHSLLALFRWGAFPRISEALGHPDIIAALPLLLQLFQAGWEPEPGVDFPQDHLWVERFGTGTDTYLSIINYTQRPCSDLLAANEALGNGVFFFESVFGDPLESLAESGKTKIKLGIRPVWLSVSKSFLNLLPATAGLQASAAISHKYQDGRKVDAIKLTLSGETVAELNFPGQSGASDPRVLINGTVVGVSSEDNMLKCQYRLKRDNVIEISYGEEIQIHPEPDAVLACDFIEGNGRGCSIVAQEASLRASAEKIRNYFLYYALAEDFERYYQSRGRTPVPDKKRVKGIPEIISAAPAGRPVISLSLNPTLPTKGKVTVVRHSPPYRLNLEGQSPKDLDAAVSKFLRLLDKKYVRYGYDNAFKKSWLKPGLLANDIPGCRRMGWAEFINYKKSWLH